MSGIIDQTGGIRKLWSGYQSSRVLITANNYRVFDYLEKPKTAGKLSSELKTDKRATEILLDALTGIRLLRKINGRYCNTGISSRFLVSDKTHYQGDIIRHADHMWRSWSNLDGVLKTGRPFRGERDHESFILGMHNLAALKAGSIIKGIGLEGVKRALDLGGGPATYSIEMAKRGVSVTLFDMPETIKIARKVIKKSGKNKGSIELIGGNFFGDDIGSGYDLIFISQIVHSYSTNDNIALFKKCRKALNKNGRIVVQEFLVSEDRTKPAQGALFAVNMLVNTEGGRTYSPVEIKSWLLKSGLNNVKKTVIAEGVLISARK